MSSPKEQRTTIWPIDPKSVNSTGGVVLSIHWMTEAGEADVQKIADSVHQIKHDK